MDKFYCMHCNRPIYQTVGGICPGDWKHTNDEWACKIDESILTDFNGNIIWADHESSPNSNSWNYTLPYKPEKESKPVYIDTTKKESITPTQNTINPTVNVNIVVFEQPKGRKFKNIV